MKRLLAYSSIAHAGYLLMAWWPCRQRRAGLLVYLAAYLFMNLGPSWCDPRAPARGTFDLRDYRASTGGAAPDGRHGLLPASLVGIRPSSASSQLYVFGAVVEKGMGLYAVIGAVNAAIAAYYYFRVLR